MVSSLSKSLPTAELLSLAVQPKVSRRGIGSALFAQVQEEFRRRGVEWFKVLAADTQKSAIAFYASLGGKVVGSTELGGLRSYVYVCPVGKKGAVTDC